MANIFATLPLSYKKERAGSNSKATNPVVKHCISSQKSLAIWGEGCKAIAYRHKLKELRMYRERSFLIKSSIFISVALMLEMAFSICSL